MAQLELLVLLLTFVGSFLGSMCIYWVKSDHSFAGLGKRLFVCTLLGLGALGLIAAFLRAEGLVPLGLSSSFLVIGMLWETPVAIGN